MASNGLTRRRAVTAGATLLLASVAGCSGGSSKGLVDNTIELGEDDYKYWTFELGSKTTLSYEFLVRNGPKIDMILLTDSEFNQYQAGNRFEHIAKGSSMASVEGSVEAKLSKGDYAFVADNTNAGEAAPPANFEGDLAKVELAASLK